MNRIFASALFVTVPCFLACSSSKDAHTDATESQTEQLCGGNMSPDSPKCPDGTTCVVDPNDACHTSGATDCPGSCKKVAPPPDAGPQACGGNMSPDSPKCPDGTTCVVDPSDACHTSGATDCPGFCVARSSAGK